MPKAIVASHNHVEPGEEDEAYLPWFYKESPQFYDWLRQTYYIHQVSQVALLYLLGGWSFVVWGFVIRLLMGIHGSALSWSTSRAVHPVTYIARVPSPAPN